MLLRPSFVAQGAAACCAFALFLASAGCGRSTTTAPTATPLPTQPPSLRIATLDWHDMVPGCGGKCALSGDSIFAYCGVSQSGGLDVTATITIAWDSGRTDSSTTTFTKGESSLGQHEAVYGMWSVPVSGAVAFATSTVPGDPKALVLQAATASCTATNPRGDVVTKSIRIPDK